jgi:hypothetical protein
LAGIFKFETQSPGSDTPSGSDSKRYNSTTLLTTEVLIQGIFDLAKSDSARYQPLSPRITPVGVWDPLVMIKRTSFCDVSDPGESDSPSYETQGF